MKNKDTNIQWDKKIMELAPILYCQKDLSMQETCMCWGFECGEGWSEPLTKLTARLELINNIFYPKYNVRIQADQVKEKYGTLHFYFSVVRDPGFLKRSIYNIAAYIYKKLGRIDYKYKLVVDHEQYTTTEIKEFENQVEYLKDMKIWINCSNVRYEEKDGKLLKYTDIVHYKKTHYEPTKHKILYKLGMFAKNIKNKAGYCTSNSSSIQKLVTRFMTDYAYTAINEAEKECSKLCEYCGRQIGDSWSPTCITAGWTKYVCEDCAITNNNEYYKNENLYKNKKLIKTKKQLTEERKARTKELDKKYKEQNKEFNAKINKAIKEATKKLSKSKKVKNESKK